MLTLQTHQEVIDVLIGLFALANISCCVAPTQIQPHHWLRGIYKVEPVGGPIPSRLGSISNDNKLRRITLKRAKSLTHDPSLVPNAYYYIAKVSFIGNEGYTNKIPEGVALTIDVDTNSIAYISSFRLTRQTATSQAPVLIISSVKLRGFRSVCGAAE